MERYHFSNSNIDLASEQAAEFLASVGVDRREALRIKLTLEEVLLECQSKFGEETVFTLKCEKRFSAPRMELVVQAEAYNPLERGENGDELISSLLAGVGLAPTWSYKNGRNYIVFTPKKKKISQTVKMIVAVLLSLVAGSLLTLLPEAVQIGLSEHFLTPVTELFLGLISAIAGPLVFLSVLGSICSMGSLENLGNIGKKTILTIFGCSASVGLVLTAIAALFYDVTTGGGIASDFSQILELIYGIVPSNLFEPFISGNALQIILIAVMFGIAALTLSAKISGVISLIEQLGFIVQTVMGFVSGLLPFAIFVIFTDMIVSRDLKNLLGFWKMLLIMLLLAVIYLTFMVLWTAARKKVAPLTLIKKVLPTFIIAFATASSAAAFSTNVEDTHKKLGVSKKLVEFATPLGQVLFKPSIYIMIGAMQLAFAESCGIEITVSWLFLGYITNLLMSFAVPPVAGGALMGLTVAFTQVGIPLEVMGVAVAINTIFDFPATATNTVGWQITMIHAADSLNLLDKEILRRDPIN